MTEHSKPLSASWRSWIALHAPWLRKGDEPQVEITPECDALVVGSGYGGSVTALRLAEKGYRVLLLERGSEYLTGEFPNDFSQLPKHLRANVPGQALPLGRASGLFEFTVGLGMVTVGANGLGGGSLINAGVVLEPDADVFAQDAWPASIRHAMGSASGKSDLQQAFATARHELGAEPYADPAGGPPLKTQALQRAAGQRPLQRVNLTIDPERCRQCGDCASGCNVPGAKRDLTQTYLKKALDTGLVQIVTLAEVFRFDQLRQTGALSKRQDLPPPEEGWRVWVFSTDEQHNKASRREAGTLQPFNRTRDTRSTLRVLKVPRLFICAGATGSTQLLQRSQAMAGNALSFSPVLGTRVSGNGDSLSVLVTPNEAVNVVGHGADPALHTKSKCNAADHTHIVGPTITAALDLRDRSKPLTERLLLQDGAVPGAISRVLTETLATVQTLNQLSRWSFLAGPLGRDNAQETDPLAAESGAPRHAQLWLTMGHDGSPARMVWMPGTDSSALVLSEPEKLPTYQAQDKLFKRLSRQGLHLHTPLWQALPPAATELMSGAKPPPMVTSVHPLGGCPMGDDPLTGVVNHLGQVWIHEPGFPGRVTEDGLPPNAPRVYPGLYVLDAAIVPTSLGCNPLLTITALAERAMALGLPALETLPTPIDPLRNPPRPVQAPVLVPAAVGATLKERLSGEAGGLRGLWTRPNARTSAIFHAQFSTDDLARTLASPSHRFDITEARLDVVREDPKKSRGLCDSQPPVSAVATYVLDTDSKVQSASQAAHFTFLPASVGSSGLWPVTRSLLELGFMVASLGLGVWQSCNHWEASRSASLLYVGLTVLGLLLQASVLPFASTMLTWLVLRGWADRSLTSFALNRLRSYFRQMVHATECRVMRYHVPMKRCEGGTADGFPPAILMTARKTVMYRASPDQWVMWALRQLGRVFPGTPSEVPPLRPTFWEQLMDAQVTIRRHVGPDQGFLQQIWRPRLLRGPLRMSLDNLFDRDTFQLGPRGDTTSGLLILSGYVLLAARFAIKTRLFDFRLPEYSRRPVSDQASADDLALRWKSAAGQEALIQPSLHRITVPRGHSSSDTGSESVDDLQLRLWRYERRDPQGKPNPPQKREGVWRTVPVIQARSILLLHAFGQSGLSYTYKADGSTSGSNLAEAFYNDGYEVWVLDSRMSTRSGYTERPSNVDMQARYDVKVTVDHITDTLQCELGADQPVQIAVFGQCIGAAALWMASLQGRLHYDSQEDSTHLRVPKIAAAMFSQVHALMEGATTTRSKTWIPALLERVITYVPFAVRGEQGMAWQLLDRLFASMPVPASERRLSRNEDGPATCRRIRFIEAPLFNHVNMCATTLADMNRLFGPANLRLFTHARRFVDQRRLVDEDGFNRYVTDTQLQNHLTFPIQLLHGRMNELFDVRSACRTHDWLRSSPNSITPQQPLLIEGYGHLDVLIGKNAAKDVFTPVLAFFKDAQIIARQALMPVHWRLAAPSVGPFVGRVRMVGTTPTVRVSCILDDWHGGEAEASVIRIRVRRPGSTQSFQTVAARMRVRRVYHTSPQEVGGTERQLAYRVAWGDFSIPADLWTSLGSGLRDIEFQLVTLHRKRTDPSSSPLNAWIPMGPHAPDDASITKKLQENAAASTAFNQGAHLQQLKQLESLEDRMAFSVPAASWRSLYELDRVEFVASCCRYPGLTVDQHRIDQALSFELKEKSLPAFALMVGDQIYADATAGLTDPISAVERYFERYATAFGPQGMGPFLSHVPTYMTPDDHEWIDNIPLASPLFKWEWPDWTRGSPFRAVQDALYRWANETVLSFQKLQTTGLFRSHTCLGPHGPLRLFMADTRSDRKRNFERIVDPFLLKALHKWLHAGSTDELNVIVTGSVVLPGLHREADPANPGVIDTWQYAPAQRQALLDMLVEHSLRCGQRFLLISGDYHVSAALEILAGDTCVGAAVVVPPMYAPLPYVNARPLHLNLQESIQAAGTTLALRAPAHGEARSGSGLARIAVERDGQGTFRIAMTRRLQVFNEALANDLEATAVITL